MSKIVIKCPSCSKPNSIGSEHLNKHARCGACQSVFLVTDQTNPAATDLRQPGTTTSHQPSVGSSGPSVTGPGSAGVSSSHFPGTTPPTASPASYPPASYSSAGYSTAMTGLSTVGGGYQCPFCHSNAGTYSRSEISTAGWVVFAVMMISCWPLFWIGLLMKEESTHCSMCHGRVA